MSVPLTLRQPASVVRERGTRIGWDAKWRASDGSDCQYDEGGDILADENANYTYNYGPDPFRSDHVLNDVAPALLFGNSYPNQSTITP